MPSFDVCMLQCAKVPEKFHSTVQKFPGCKMFHVPWNKSSVQQKFWGTKVNYTV